MLWLYLLLSALFFASALQTDSTQDVSEFLDLEMDENGRLTKHLMMYPGGRCSVDLQRGLRSASSNHRSPVSVAPGSSIYEQFSRKYKYNNETGCFLVCLERGTHIDQVASPMPYHVFEGDVSEMHDWFVSNCQSAEVGFVSYNEVPTKVYWVDNSGKKHIRATIDKGERHTFWSSSFLGHHFLLEDSESGEELLRIEVEQNGFYSVGEFKSLRKDINMEGKIKQTLQHEWVRSRRVTRTFTELGFTKGRLPDDLWGSISAYYYNNRNNMVREEWESKGPFVNWWEVDAFMIQMPWKLKRTWQTRLKLLVEDWSGEELENTDIYGMRRYERGARLLHHTDREATHAASLIINVAQGIMNRPWTVEIYDFADRLHEVVMEPGDIVYYESAKCLHGRNTPLDGEYYVNLFSHYRPIGDDKWFLRENPGTTPDPLMEVGKCKVLNHNIDPNDASVACDGAGAHVTSLSPTMHTLNGADDLFKWWKYSKVREYDGKHDEL